MRKLSVFNHISIDGYFCDASNSMQWAHRDDPEMKEFAAQNSQGDGPLVFGRKTFEEMKAHWPTEAGRTTEPTVAAQMTRMPKFVFSRTMTSTDWANTTFLSGNPVTEMERLKAEDGPDLTILGSGSIVRQLAAAKLIDGYMLMLNPIVLGGGRTLFEGLADSQTFKLANAMPFKSGNVLLNYSAG
jgi:dihydrofolate reductase